ncbi:MarR family winged helix-turn-helix transcriptional regulator [Nocardia sp. alder85J]|uniref:MarR family winged helix-turn-helix transcriptional regulator n=1 Tax=Nocardia sp. alder85J TaxID=2862949 RepID=UPI001CD5C2D4|nr:MarR family transcriptional regulator [Nocardia sp. alder85J]MCX4092987.1 MarR family transcriptional regulator [Nocardia sp. alder85J]
MTTDDSGTARELRLVTGRLARRMRRLLVDAEEGVAFLELAVLHRLDRDGPASPGSLSSDEDVTTPAIAGVLRHLEELGLVERTRDPADGRRVVVTITEAGRRGLRDRGAAVVGRIHTVLRDDLDESEHAALTAALPVLAKIAGRL